MDFISFSLNLLMYFISLTSQNNLYKNGTELFSVLSSQPGRQESVGSLHWTEGNTIISLN